MLVYWVIEASIAVDLPEQCAEVPDEELAACSTEADRETLIRRYVQEDFRDRVSWAIVRREPTPSEETPGAEK